MVSLMGEVARRPRRSGAANDNKANGHDKINVFEHLAKIKSAEEILATTYPPLRYVIPGVVPEGVSLLVSRPKLGKSWLALDIAVAVGAGRFVLGDKRPEQGAVLYCALEDGEARLQRRLVRILRCTDEPFTGSLDFLTDCPRANDGGLEVIGTWAARPNARLVVVDTLARFRELRATDSYASDYEALTGLQQIATLHRIGILVCHHDRKAGADDVFDTVSGTLGLNGACDTMMMLKRVPESLEATLAVRGRDVDDSNLLLEWSKTACRWSIRGQTEEIRRDKTRSAVKEMLEQNLPMREILVEAGISRRTFFRIKRELKDQPEVGASGTRWHSDYDD